MMTEKEITDAYRKFGYHFERGGGESNYVLIPIKDYASLWTSFESLESAEKALHNLEAKANEKPEDEVKSNPIPRPQTISNKNYFLSLRDEVRYCLRIYDIQAYVWPAKCGEHHVKVSSDTNLDGLVFDSGAHKISFGACTNMFGQKFFVAGRKK